MPSMHTQRQQQQHTHTADRQKHILWKTLPREALTQPPARVQAAVLLFIRAHRVLQNVISWWLW